MGITKMETQTQGKTTEDNDNQEQIQTQDKELLSHIVGLRPAHQPF